VGRGDLTDAQWARLAPLLPVGIKSGRPPVHSKRQLIDGIRWRTRAGVPWRDMPERYGPWETVYGLFRRWQRDGTWQDILTKLQAQADADGLITWDVSVDSTVNRAHQHAAGVRKNRTAVRRALARTGSWPTRPTVPRPTGPTCAGVGSRPPSRSRMTRRPTGATKGPGAGGHRRSTPRRTSSAPNCQRPARPSRLYPASYPSRVTRRTSVNPLRRRADLSAQVAPRPGHLSHDRRPPS
jgi:transposase